MKAKNVEEFLIEAKEYFEKDPKVLAVIVFGSYARGDFSARHSDVDLFVVYQGRSEDIEEKFETNLIKMARPFKLPVHLTVCNYNPDADAISLFVKQAEEGRIILSRGLLFIPYEKVNLKPVFPLTYSLTNTSQTLKNKFVRGIAQLSQKNRNEITKIGQGGLIISGKIKDQIEDLARICGVKIHYKRYLLQPEF